MARFSITQSLNHSITQSLLCPAKINLGLRIGARRADGYHHLYTVFQTIAIHDRLSLALGDGASEIELRCNVRELSGPTNLAARAAQAIFDALGVRRRRLRITLRKVIPAGSGLGGGSSDAAAVLRVLPEMLGRRLPRERRMALAAALGADVPFFLVGGRAVGAGRGTELRPLPDQPPRSLVVVVPDMPISTSDAYRDLDVWRETHALTERSADHIIYEDRLVALQNDFEPVVFSAYPELARLKAILTRAGASPALLSGSGSAMFGVFERPADARRAAAVVRKSWPGWRRWVTRTVSRRELQREA